MDKVRLGRALGYGTRHAAKTLAKVAEAATAPDPRRGGSSPGDVVPPEATRARPVTASAEPAARARAPRMPDPATLRGAGRSVWAPLATYSSALWLRVTGLFFAMVSLVMANGAWRLRAAVHAAANSVERRHLYLFAGFAVLFAYFAVSGFVRANLRERRGASPAR